MLHRTFKRDAETHQTRRRTPSCKKQLMLSSASRGLTLWIDRVDGGKLTITLFSGDPTGLKALFKDENVVPKDRAVYAAVANEELRTYNPPVDSMRCKILEIHNAPAACYGCSGEPLGYRTGAAARRLPQGLIIRLFLRRLAHQRHAQGRELV